MRRLHHHTLFALAAIVAIGACDTRADRPTPVHDPTEFVFEGRVVGFVEDSTRTGMYRPSRWILPLHAPAAGVLVEPISIVQAPRVADAYAIFLHTGRRASESSGYSTIHDLERRYAVGDTVAVMAAHHAEDGLGSNLDQAVPLWIQGWGSMIPETVSYAPWPSELWHRNVYREFADTLDARIAEAGAQWRENPEGHQKTFPSLRDVRDARMDYEFQRDLARLEEGLPLKERIFRLFKISGRMSGSPTLDPCTYQVIVHEYLPRQRDRIELEARLIYGRRQLYPSEEGCRLAEKMFRGERLR